jgi:serine/threonine protein kinase
MCTESAPDGQNSQIYIITELMANGSLLDFLKRKTPESLPFAQLIDMLSQVAEGMAYMEAKSFIHRELRAASIMVGDKLEVKVSDFELARVIQATDEGIYLADAQNKFPV